MQRCRGSQRRGWLTDEELHQRWTCSSAIHSELSANKMSEQASMNESETKAKINQPLVISLKQVINQWDSPNPSPSSVLSLVLVLQAIVRTPIPIELMYVISSVHSCSHAFKFSQRKK